MERLIRINKNEFEAFLAELTELSNRHEEVLKRLDQAEAKLEGMNSRIRQQISKSSQTLRQLTAAIEERCRRTEEMLEASVSERP